MKVLVDTNLLTRAADAAHPKHDTATRAITAVTTRGDTPCLVPQNLYEFWVVCTRPLSENGLGMTTDLVLRQLDDLKQAFDILDETPAFRPTWEALVAKHNVQGKSAHDARLVVAMKVYGLTTILTFNKQHFLRYEGIAILSPEEAVAPTR
jgi:predicted nucleic acid-binding protein